MTEPITIDCGWPGFSHEAFDAVVNELREDAAAATETIDAAPPEEPEDFHEISYEGELLAQLRETCELGDQSEIEVAASALSLYNTYVKAKKSGHQVQIETDATIEEIHDLFPGDD